MLIPFFLAATSIGHLALAAVTYRLGTPNRSRNLFSLVAFFLFLWTGSWAIVIIAPEEYTLSLTKILTIPGYLSSIFWLLLCKRFPEEKYEPSKKMMTFLAAHSLLSIVLPIMAPHYIYTAYIDNDAIIFTAGFFYYLLTFSSISYWLIGLFLLLKKSFKHTANSKHKNQIYYIFLGGVLSAFSVLIFSGILPLLGVSEYNAITPASTLIFIGFWTYAIINHNLSDIRLFISEGTAKTISLHLIVALGLSIVLVPSLLFPGDKNILIPCFVVSFFLLTTASENYDKMRSFFTKYISKIVLGSYLDIDKSMKDVHSMMKFPELDPILQSVIVNTMFHLNLLHVDIYIREGYEKDELGQTLTRLPSFHTVENIPDQFSINQEIVKYLIENGFVSEDNPERKQDLYNYRVKYMAPIIARDELMAIITFSEKETGKFTPYDIAFMKKTASLLQDVFLTQQIHEINRVNLGKSQKTASMLSLMSQYQHDLYSDWVTLKGVNDWLRIQSGIETQQPKTKDSLDGSNFDWKANFTKLSDLILKHYFRADQLMTTITQIINGQDYKYVRDVNLKDAIEEIMHMFDGKGMSVERNYDKRQTLVKADKQDLQILFVNLLKNARESFKTNEIPDRTVHLSTQKTKDTVVIKVKDRCGGLPPEVQEAWKENKSITMGKAKGSGLGLVTMRRIINELKGSIEFEIDEGLGTTFIITLNLV